jgi:SEC-C motif-containing protein
MRPNDPCPCHSGAKYKRCCGPFHGGAPAPTPEALMRSRYAAFALGLVQYLMDTTDPQGPHYGVNRARWGADLEGYCGRATFPGLEVRGTGSDGDTGWVEFRAEVTLDGKDASFVEHSTFTRRGGRWLYTLGKGRPDTR